MFIWGELESKMLLEVKNIQVAYGRVTALWDISLNVENGELVVLVGANGAGKTTTLKAIMGLVPKINGRVFFDGKDITHWPPWRVSQLGLGFVPEGARVFPELTVYENLLIGGYKIDRHLLLQNIYRVCELFPVLKQRLRQRAGTLSGGERQMLAIARALMGSPRLLLVDEISMGLMPKMVEQVFSTLTQLNREKNVSILMAEQNVRESLVIASSAYVIENGRVVLSGTPKDLLGNDYIKTAYLGL